MIDMMTFLLMDKARAKGFHLEGATGQNPLYAWADDFDLSRITKYADLKSKSGSPWDINLVTSEAIYLWITEWNDAPPHNYWADPSSYKKFVDNGWLVEGVAFCPRYMVEKGSSDVTFYTPASKGIHIYKCKIDVTSSIGDVKTITHSPTIVDCGGNIPNATPSILVEFFYSGRNGIYQSRERFHYALGYGLIEWDMSNLTAIGGNPMIYNVTQTTLHNRLVAGGGVKITFPCPSY